MSGPWRVPSDQARRFHVELAKRLGVDPEKVDSNGFTVNTDGDDAHIEWRGVAVLPTQEFIDLFNDTAVDREGQDATPPAEKDAATECEVRRVLAQHRVNYHHRNVGPEPVTADNLRYTSCEGCDWLGGHRDEAGWEAHLAALLTRIFPPGGGQR